MKKLYRSQTNRQLCGVCGGLADYINLDATVVRLLVIVIGLCTAIVPLLLFYIIAAVVIPEDPGYHDI